MTQSERFGIIERMLLSRRSVTFAELQQRLEVSRATLHRDLRDLRDAEDEGTAEEGADHGGVGVGVATGFDGFYMALIRREPTTDLPVAATADDSDE